MRSEGEGPHSRARVFLSKVEYSTDDSCLAQYVRGRHLERAGTVARRPHHRRRPADLRHARSVSAHEIRRSYLLWIPKAPSGPGRAISGRALRECAHESSAVRPRLQPQPLHMDQRRAAWRHDPRDGVLVRYGRHLVPEAAASRREYRDTALVLPAEDLDADR